MVPSAFFVFLNIFVILFQVFLAFSSIFFITAHIQLKISKHVNFEYFIYVKFRSYQEDSPILNQKFYEILKNLVAKMRVRARVCPPIQISHRSTFCFFQHFFCQFQSILIHFLPLFRHQFHQFSTLPHSPILSSFFTYNKYTQQWWS